MPAVPVDIAGVLGSLVMLGIRAQQGEQAYQSITKAFTIGHFAAWRSQRSSPRRYGRRSAHRVDLTSPEQEEEMSIHMVFSCSMVERGHPWVTMRDSACSCTG